jgi:3-oxoacyl-[acyl-carrier-protein] synthase II
MLVPGCTSRGEFWESLERGDSKLRMSPDPSAPERQIAMGRVNDEGERLLEDLPEKARTRWSREQKMHLASVLLARDDAGLQDAHELWPDRIGIFDGTSRTNIEYMVDRLEQRRNGRTFTKQELAIGLPNHAAALAASYLGVRGPVYTVGATCASGAVAVAAALRAIERGEIDIAYATGHDMPLLAPVFETYHAAGLLSREAECAERALVPFVDARGTVFSEGSVTMVLESHERAVQRGANMLAILTDCAHGNTGVHATHVDASGEVPARLIAGLLARNHVRPSEIDFVLGHGNGVSMTYASEIGCMRHIFGPYASAVPLLSTKPIFGHLFGGASALDVAAAVLMVHHGRTFSTINAEPARVPAGVRHHGGPLPAGRARCGLATSYGMGGQISAVLVQHPGTPDWGARAEPTVPMAMRTDPFVALDRLR